MQASQPRVICILSPVHAVPEIVTAYFTVQADAGKKLATLDLWLVPISQAQK